MTVLKGAGVCWVAAEKGEDLKRMKEAVFGQLGRLS